MGRITVDERRLRLALRHHLARPAGSVEAAVEGVVGLHSSDPATVFLSAWARVDPFAPSDLERALYERRTLVRMLGMRRTMFVVPVRTAAVMDEACTTAFAAGERRRLARIIEEQDVARPGRGERWVERVATATLVALTRRGEATARELTKDVPELTTKLSFGEGKTWAGTMGVSTRILFLLATEGRIVRARPLGSWLSGQYRWAPTERWLGGPLPTIGRAGACAELLRGYLRAFGPATTTDIRWWTGWTAKLTAATLAAIGAAEVSLDDGTGWVLSDDVRTTDLEAGSWVALLPGLDATVMGWKERAWYLDGQEPALFDRAGNAGPTVWADGRVVGGWTQAEDGTVLVELLGPVPARTRKRIDAERERLGEWLAGTQVRIRTRFRTPFERRLASQGFTRSLPGSAFTPDERR